MERHSNGKDKDEHSGKASLQQQGIRKDSSGTSCRVGGGVQRGVHRARGIAGEHIQEGNGRLFSGEVERIGAMVYIGTAIILLIAYIIN